MDFFFFFFPNKEIKIGHQEVGAALQQTSARESVLPSKCVDAVMFLFTESICDI